MGHDQHKRLAAEASLAYIEPGMRVGLGTGSTAAHMIRGLGARVRDGLRLAGVAASSETSRSLAESEGIEVSSLELLGGLDLYIDGADEIGPGLDLIKGGGGALLHEKILAAASSRFVVIADASKRVERLGKFGVPIEIIGAATPVVLRKVHELGGSAAIRMEGASAFRTDEGNLILDAQFGLLGNPGAIAHALSTTPGVVEHGLFVQMAAEALVATTTGLEVLRPGP